MLSFFPLFPCCFARIPPPLSPFSPSPSPCWPLLSYSLSLSLSLPLLLPFRFTVSMERISLRLSRLPSPVSSQPMRRPRSGNLRKSTGYQVLMTTLYYAYPHRECLALLARTTAFTRSDPSETFFFSCSSLFFFLTVFLLFLFLFLPVPRFVVGFMEYSWNINYNTGRDSREASILSRIESRIEDDDRSLIESFLRE